MKKVPDMISTKDLSYIADAFEWNFTMCKKALTYANEVSDEEVGTILDNVYNLHKNICEDLLKLLV